MGNVGSVFQRAGGLLCLGRPLSRPVGSTSIQPFAGPQVCVGRSPAPRVDRGVPFLLALSSWADWGSLGRNVASLILVRALGGSEAWLSLGGTVPAIRLQVVFLLWVDKFKMNSVHLNILKFISLGKTKWVCSWPCFSAEIGSPQLSKDLSSKSVCESWCSFSDAVLCMVLNRLPQESLSLRGHRPFSFTLPVMPLQRRLAFAPDWPCAWNSSLSGTPGLFLPWGLLNCCSLPGVLFPYESAWLLPSPQWGVNSDVTSEIPSLTTSGEVPTPAPIAVFQTVACCLLVCLLFPLPH